MSTTTSTMCATFDAAKAGLDSGREELQKTDAGIEGYQIRILKTVSELEEFRQLWTRWRTIPYSDIDFFLTTIGAQKPAAQPHVVVLSSRGLPQAMAVGYVAETELNFKVSYKSLFRSRLKTLTIVTGGLLGDQSPAAAGAMVSALLQELRSGQIGAIIIGHTRAESDFYQLMQKAVPLLCKDRTVEFDRHWRMTLRGTMEEVYAGLSGDHRKKLRWQNKNFEKNFPGALRVHCFREPAELEQMAGDVAEIANKTYQRALGSSFVDDELNRQRIALEAKQGWLRMYVLYVGGKPAAYWWGTLYYKTFYSEAMGFDSEYRRYSPGIYLLTKAIEDLCQNGIKQLDFGAGDFQYKRQFGTDYWDETMVFFVFAPRLRPVVLNMIRTIIGGFRFFTRRVLKHLQALELIRKFWRRRLGTKPEASERPLIEAEKQAHKPGIVKTD